MTSAAQAYAARVDAVLAQRTRLRGPQPPGDLFAALPPDHPLVKSDPKRPLNPNLEVIASYVTPEDVILDVGGGSGRYSLPLALRCQKVINIDPSGGMLAGFQANAKGAGITNIQAIEGGWPYPSAPRASVVLVNHVTYLTRDIVTFLEKLSESASRRVLLTVNSPPPPSWNRELYLAVHGEAEEIVPGHAELMNVLWEMGIEPDLKVLPLPTGVHGPFPTREEAIQISHLRFSGDQWSFWPMSPDLSARVKTLLEEKFEELFLKTEEGYSPRWIKAGREILITWETR